MRNDSYNTSLAGQLLNETSTQNSSTKEDKGFFISKIVSYSLVAIFILVGNLICLVVFLRTKRMRRKPYYLLVSLSVADFLIGVSILESISLELTTTVSGKSVSSTLYFLVGPASMYMLAAISVERFIVTVFPLFYHRNTGKGLYLMLLGIPWTVATAVLILYILAYKLAIIPTITITYARITTAISLTTIIVCYSALVIKMKYFPSIQASNKSQQALRDQKLAVTLTIVTLISLVTWTPYGVYATVVFFMKGSSAQSQRLFLALNWLKYFNSGVNVIVYMYRMPEFKRALLGKRFQNSVASQATTSSRTDGD